MTFQKIIALEIMSFAAISAFSATPSDSSQSFTITISTSQVIVKPGDEIRVHVALTNTSDKTLALRSSPSNEMAEMFYTVMVHDKSGKVAPDTERGRDARQHEYSGSVGIYWLKPGETWKEDVLLGGLFDLSAPGKYDVQLSRHIDDDPEKKTVTSNKLTITVTE